MTDTKRCGAIHPKKSIEICARELGHVGMHSNGGNVTWKQAKPDAAKEPALTDKCDKCNRELGEHDGRKCPPEAEAVDQWGQNIAETPKQKLDAVFGGPATEPAKSRKRHVEPEIRVHPAADVLPLIEGDAFEAFVEDVRVNGLRKKPLLDHSGAWLVDGRNRKRALDRLGMPVEYDRLPEGANIEAYVISENLTGRRHLDEGARAMCASEIANLSQGQRKSRPGAGLDKGITQAEAAAAAGVGLRTVQRANAVRDKAVPELVTAVKQGKVDLKGAEQVAKLSPAKQRQLVKERIDPSKTPVRGGKLAALARQEEKREVVRKINAEQVAPAPVGPFRVIVADFPWPYDNSDQHDGSRGHIPYPAMSIEQGLAMAGEIEKLAHEDGCILAFWVTNAFIPEAVGMVQAWGFSWRTMFTWDKQRDGIGTWGRGRTEHLIIAERGEIEAHTLNEVSTLITAPRREHSRKPDEVMELLRVHCPGPYLDMFAREPRSGWASWGAEVQKFAGAA